MVGLPHAIDDGQPFVGAGIAVVVLLERDAVLGRLVRPPRRDDIEAQSAARDIVDSRRLLGEKGGIVERRPHRDHDFLFFGHGGECCRRRPRIKRRGLDPFDVVEVQLCDKGEVEADLLGPNRQPGRIAPRGVHVFVVDVSQPPAKHGQPVSVAHGLILQDGAVEGERVPGAFTPTPRFVRWVRSDRRAVRGTCPAQTHREVRQNQHSAP